ncbi:MAG: DUF2341 domain-containing protein [Fibrobacter sp.]|nr:DUF2341 domain-containing protein [Fibrobacter sp.]
MNTIVVKKYFTMLFTTTLLLMQCGEQISGTVDTGNAKIAGIIVNKDGTAARNAFVRCIPSDYVPGISSNGLIRNGVTNGLGAYSFDGLDSGEYVITAIDLTSLDRCMIDNAVVGDDTVTLQTGTLDATGSIKIPVPDHASFSNGFFYIPGTTIASLSTGTITDGFVVLDSVPPGKIATLRYASDTNQERRIIRYDVPVAPSKVTTIYNTFWKYQKDIVINTSSGGANITTALKGFPLLVRLDTTTISFNDIKTNGGDLMFRKPDNTMLPFEIERWEPSQGIGEIWVMVDTIQPDNSEQHIVLYYGNPDAERTANDKFDTTSGLKAVWHFNSTLPLVSDASRSQWDGTANGSVQQYDGIIGKGIHMRDSNGYVNFKNVGNPQMSNLTISAWIKKTVNGKIQTIAAKSTGGDPSVNYGWNIAFDPANQFHCYIATGGSSWDSAGAFGLQTTAQITDTLWHHVAVVFDRTGNFNCKLFIDGDDKSATRFGDITTVGLVTNTSNLTIGAEADGDFAFSGGSIDDFVLSFTARSSDWIKMSYMNQRKDSRILTIK